MKNLKEWYLSKLPERWKNKTGLGMIIFMWIVCIPTFEVYWFFTGVVDPWAVFGMPAFFGILTLIIAKWSLRLF